MILAYRRPKDSGMVKLIQMIRDYRAAQPFANVRLRCVGVELKLGKRSEHGIEYTGDFPSGADEVGSA